MNPTIITITLTLTNLAWSFSLLGLKTPRRAAARILPTLLMTGTGFAFILLPSSAEYLLHTEKSMLGCIVSLPLLPALAGINPQWNWKIKAGSLALMLLILPFIITFIWNRAAIADIHGRKLPPDTELPLRPAAETMVRENLSAQILQRNSNTEKQIHGTFILPDYGNPGLEFAKKTSDTLAASRKTSRIHDIIITAKPTVESIRLTRHTLFGTSIPTLTAKGQVILTVHIIPDTTKQQNMVEILTDLPTSFTLVFIPDTGGQNGPQENQQNPFTILKLTTEKIQTPDPGF